MLNKVKLTNGEIREFAEVFAFYDYGENEIGMVPYYPGLPVIVSTDARLKKDKYAHIGMKLVNTRTLGEKSYMYDLVREGEK